MILFITKGKILTLRFKVGNERLVEAEDELTYGVERLRVGFFRFGTRITNRQLQGIANQS